MSRVRIVSYANSVSLSKIAYTAKFYRQRQISTNRLRKSESVLYSPQSLDRGASSAETAAATSLVRLSEAQTDEGCIRRKPAPFKWLAPRPDRARNRIGFKSDAHAGRFCKLASFRPPKSGGEPSARAQRKQIVAGRDRPGMAQSIGNDATSGSKVAPADRFQFRKATEKENREASVMVRLIPTIASPPFEERRYLCREGTDFGAQEPEKIGSWTELRAMRRASEICRDSQETRQGGDKRGSNSLKRLNRRRQKSGRPPLGASAALYRRPAASENLPDVSG